MKELSQEIQNQIEQEAKTFAFYNYVSAGNDPSAVFDDIETWPKSALVCFYSIYHYMTGLKVCWPFPEPTLASKWQEAEQRVADLNLALAAMLNGYQNLSMDQKDWFTVPKDLIDEYTKMVLEYDGTPTPKPTTNE